MSESTFRKRLEALIKRVGSAAELARRAKISDRSIRSYLKGQTQPKGVVVARLADAGGVHHAWLLSDEGPMTETPPAIAQPPAAYDIGVSDAARFVLATAAELRFDPGAAWTALLIELMTTDSLKPSGARKVLMHLASFREAGRDAAA